MASSQANPNHVDAHVDARGCVFNEVHGHHIVVGQRTRSDSTDLNLSLAPVDAACNRRGPVFRCLEGTHEELLAKIMRWVDGDPERPICWVHGPDGSGKSTVAQSVGEYFDSTKQMAASFFFMRGEEKRSTVAHFVPTLAYQLSISVRATRALLAEALEIDPTIPQKSLRYQFEKLMVEPILAVRKRAGLAPKLPAVIIIDALDECSDKESIVEFIETITDACMKHRPFPFRIFITSRVENHIRRKLEGSAADFTYPLDLQNADAGDDIRRFFRYRCSAIYNENHRVMRDIAEPWPSDSDIEALVKKAGGSFRRASEFISFIDDEIDPDRQLAVVLGAKRDRRRRRSSGIFKIIRWPSRSSQSSASESSHVVSPSTAAAMGTRSASWVTAGPRAMQLWVNTSDAPPHTHEPTMSSESPVSQDEDVTIETTTLEGLIDNLILPCVRNPEEYRDIFFTTYTAFTTTDEVFQSLVRRFHDAETTHVQYYTHLPIHIIKIMKYWVMTPHFEVHTDDLARMKEFAASIQSLGAIKKSAQALQSATAERLVSLSTSHTTISRKPTESIKATEPRDLAIALLILEGDKYTRILPAHFISYFQQQPGGNDVRDALETNYTISCWIQWAILRCDELGARSGVLKFFISVAEESHKLHNFGSMSAILIALLSKAITRLTLTYDQLPEDVKRMMERMKAFLNPRDNLSVYLATLSSTNLPCVPVLDAHIADIHTAFSKLKETVNVDGRAPTINFSKWTEFHARINAVLRHKPPDVSEYRRTSAGVLAYLERQLSDNSPGSPMDQDPEQRSSKLFDQEEQIRNQPNDRCSKAIRIIK